MSSAAPLANTSEPLTAMLQRLAEIGMEIAEAAGRQARDGDAREAAVAYARVARAVRLTLFLQSRLAGDQAAHRRATAARRRDRIHARVEQQIEAERSDADAAERLSSAAWERLTETEDDDALFDLPLPDAVARIRHDLGLPPQSFTAAFAQTGPASAPPFCLSPPCGSPPPPPPMSSSSGLSREPRGPPQGRLTPLTLPRKLKPESSAHGGG